MERLIAIGDIHGEYVKLRDLINKLHLQSSDKIIFLGDYIDIGLKSKKVVDFLLYLNAKFNCVFLMGNHEHNLLKAKYDGNSDFVLNGGIETINSYGTFENIFKIHGMFFTSLKTHYLYNGYLFVHAGVNPYKELEDQDFVENLEIREEFINNNHCLKQKIIFGHTDFIEPFVAKDKIGIDTGCGKYPEAKLTAYICNENRFIQN